MLLDDDAPFTFLLLPTRCNAADNADLVSSHAGLSQSSPPDIDFSNDASLSLLLLLGDMVFYCNIKERIVVDILYGWANYYSPLFSPPSTCHFSQYAILFAVDHLKTEEHICPATAGL